MKRMASHLFITLQFSFVLLVEKNSLLHHWYSRRGEFFLIIEYIYILLVETLPRSSGSAHPHPTGPHVGLGGHLLGAAFLLCGVDFCGLGQPQHLLAHFFVNPSVALETLPSDAHQIEAGHAAHLQLETQSGPTNIILHLAPQSVPEINKYI